MRISCRQAITSANHANRQWQNGKCTPMLCKCTGGHRTHRHYHMHDVSAVNWWRQSACPTTRISAFTVLSEKSFHTRLTARGISPLWYSTARNECPSSRMPIMQSRSVSAIRLYFTLLFKLSIYITGRNFISTDGNIQVSAYSTVFVYTCHVEEYKCILVPDACNYFITVILCKIFCIFC